MSMYFLLFWQGVLTFFAPCFLPMLPVYVVYLSANKRSDHKLLFFNTLSFIAGFSVVFVTLGASAGAFSVFFISNKNLFLRIMGYFICCLAVYYLCFDLPIFIKLRAYIGNFLSALNIKRIPTPLSLMQASNKSRSESAHASPLTSFFMGCTFSLSWSACISANLGYALALAATSATMVDGIILLALFSLGLAIPFVVFVMLLYRLTSCLRFLQRHSRKIQIFAGIVMFLSGVALINGYSLFAYADFLSNLWKGRS